MKVRRLSAIVTIIILAVILLIGSIYKKSIKLEYNNNSKSYLTTKQSEENPNNPTLRVGLKSIIAGNLKKQVEMFESKELKSDEILTRERSYTEAEILDMSQSQFVDLLKTIDSKLPTIADIKLLPAGALHHTPTLIIQAGKDLGLIKEVVALHKSFESDAVLFYEKCAKANDRPVPVKALCLTNLIQIKKKNNESINLAAYPKHIVELTKLIIDI